MTEEDEIAQRELINWGILERNRVNEVSPTIDFMVWLIEYIYHEAAEGGLDGFDSDDETEITTLQSDFIRNQIITWTMQKAKDGHSYVERLNVSRHTKIVREIIRDISDRIFEIHTLKLGNKNKKPIFYDDDTGVSADPNKGETEEDFRRKIEEYWTDLEKERREDDDKRRRWFEDISKEIKERKKKKEEKNLEEKESKKAKPSEFDTKLDSY